MRVCGCVTQALLTFDNASLLEDVGMSVSAHRKVVLNKAGLAGIHTHTVMFYLVF